MLSNTQVDPPLSTTRPSLLNQIDKPLSHSPSVDKPDVISSVFLAASSLIRNNFTRASIELHCPPWLSVFSLSRQGEVCSWTRVAMFCLLCSTRFMSSSKVWIKSKHKGKEHPYESKHLHGFFMHKSGDTTFHLQ